MPTSRTLMRIALENRENTYKNLIGYKWKLSHMYFFLVTPKGKKQKHKDYVATLKRDMLALRPYNYAIWIKEYENTDHIHGIIGTLYPSASRLIG